MFFFFKERQYNLTTRLHIRGLCFESCLGFDAAGIPAEGNFNKRAFFSGEQSHCSPKAELLGQIVWVMVWNHRGHVRESEDVPRTSSGGHTGGCPAWGWGPGCDDGGWGPGSSGGLSGGSWAGTSPPVPGLLASRAALTSGWYFLGIFQEPERSN